MKKRARRVVFWLTYPFRALFWSVVIGAIMLVLGVWMAWDVCRDEWRPFK